MNDWNDAELRVEKAQELFEQHRWQEALEELQAATSINPYNGGWFFNTGLTLDEMERFDEAIEAYRKALEIDEQDVHALNCMGVDLHRVGRYQDALAAFEKIEAIDPSFEQCYCNRIATYRELDDHERAEEMFYLARLYREHCPHCYYYIGCSLLDRGQFDRAIYCWKRTLDLDDRYPDAQMRIADACWQKGELEAARQHFLAGLRQDPGDTEALLDLGELLLEMGQNDEAGEKFRRAIELSPDDPSGYFCHGRWLTRCGRDEPAMAALLKTLQLDPTYPGANMRLGEIYQRRRNRAQARKCFRAEVALRNDDPDLLLELSNLLIDNGQTRSAIECLKRMTHVDPQNVSGWQNLAVAHFLRGQYQPGIESCEEALRREPDNLLTLFNLALALEHQGQYSAALAWVERGLTVDPRELAFQKLEFRLRVLRSLHRLKRFFARLMFWKH